MDPIGSANKYLAIAMEEYGLDDYTVAIENEESLNEEFGAFDALTGLMELGGKIAKGYADNKETIDGAIKLAGQAQKMFDKGTKTTQKGRSRVSSGENKMKSARSSKSMNRTQKKLEMARGKMQKINGQLQMALGEMRRQLAVTGVNDPDLQLEVVRNAFTKQYFDMDSSKKLEKVLLKKTILNMDKKLMEAFQRRNQDRVARGMRPLVASYQQPTLEYKV